MKRFNTEQVVYYHERTKHHFHRYAKSSGSMDWANQPHPFRVYDGCPNIRLPLLQQDPATDHAGLYRGTGADPEAITLSHVAGFLELSMGLSAWKSAAGSRWALRINPSSGNLHPTEAHLFLPQMDELNGGVYHYDPLNHALEQRSVVPAGIWQTIIGSFGVSGFFIGLSSIFWRESWKYGERAFRYCQLDVGHALGAIRFSANLFGWQATYLNGMSDQQISRLLGFHKTSWQPLEEEHPDLMIFVHPGSRRDIRQKIDDRGIKQVGNLDFLGTPAPLSANPVNWEIIYRTADASAKPATEQETNNAFIAAASCFLPSIHSATEIIRKRRSATGYDKNGTITGDSFLAILEKSLPVDETAPFDLAIGIPAVHLFLFVHRVAGIDPGLYCLVRNEAETDELRQCCRPDFLWKPIKKDFPLYLLEKADLRFKAMELSCYQEIAGDSAFSMGMIANFEESIARGAHKYRSLFWECGLIGQALYLEAEAQGMRGTGIGCFFDDPVRELLGIQDKTWESLYHFTIGVPLEDSRLATLPAYVHRK